MGFLDPVVRNFQQSSLLELAIPFLLVFAVLYGILRKLDLFDSQEIDGVIGLLGALIVVGYTPFVQGVFYAYITNLFGAVAVLLFAILAFHMIEQMARGDDRYKDSWVKWGVGAVVLLLFIGYGGPRMLTQGNLTEVEIAGWVPFLSTVDFIILLCLAIIVGVLWFIYTGGDESGGGGGG